MCRRDARGRAALQHVCGRSSLLRQTAPAVQAGWRDGGGRRRGDGLSLSWPPRILNRCPSVCFEEDSGTSVRCKLQGTSNAGVFTGRCDGFLHFLPQVHLGQGIERTCSQKQTKKISHILTFAALFADRMKKYLNSLERLPLRICLSLIPIVEIDYYREPFFRAHQWHICRME